MKPFLQQIAETLVTQYTQLSDLVLVLPSKRAGLFLRDQLLQHNQKTGFGPSLYSIETFVKELSGLKTADTTVLLFELYDTYRQLTPEKEAESFHSFAKWGTMLLQDFNEIDRYLIDSQNFFTYLSSIKELNHWYLKEEKTTLQKNYIRFWQRFGNYYQKFTERLLEKQTGYQGLLYREAVANIEHYLQNHSGKNFVFIGFNALNKAESVIIQEFLEFGNTRIFWDIDPYFISNPEHDAGFFIRKYLKEWKYFKKHPPALPESTFTQAKNIQITGIPKNVGQAKYVGQLIQKWQEQGKTLQNTAIILGNELLLAPVLNALPSSVTRVNITGGYPLFLTPVASFFNAWFELIANHSAQGHYYQHLVNFLSHPMGKMALLHEKTDYATKLLQRIHHENLVFVDSDTLTRHFAANTTAVVEAIFLTNEKTPVSKIIQNASSLIAHLKEVYQTTQKQPLYLEYLYRLYRIFNQIALLNTQYNHIGDLKGLRHVFKELIHQETIDFQGEPLQGLQVMGVLESRNLDFENIIVTSVNEGILPSGKTDASFIPFDLKTAYGIPTYKEKDAVYTYHFYHLLQKAKNICLLYNTEPDVLEGSEKSRFLLQLTLSRMPMHHITETTVAPEVHIATPPPVSVEKNPSLLSRLSEIAEKGFSPTALTTFIRNPLDFYMQSVLGIRNEAELEETVAANTLGTVVHDTLEALYKPFEGHFLHADTLLETTQNIVTEVKKNFTKTYRGGDMSRGKNLLVFNIAVRYVEKFLEMEIADLRAGASIQIIHLEQSLKTPVPVPELDFPVYIQGKADRIDKRNGTLRIIDYKTGKVQQNELELYDWNLLTTDYKYSKAFQVLAYAYMLQDLLGTHDTEAGIISFKNYQGGFLRFAVKEGPRAREKHYGITTETLENFRLQLQQLILEICHPQTPFIEKEIS
ncbi:PD-(D/E)XK nuclease family protein [Ascidiimonas aurantiaca]|uniref:PD-(D/E)XK nuclease family protein n=1 Tax=Ascidiimonas aurantiaca TaxID=1685432 RepID=UPI0030EBED94